jgi:U4/U6.U5 tri-snRNP-associated protein 2
MEIPTLTTNHSHKRSKISHGELIQSEQISSLDYDDTDHQEHDLLQISKIKMSEHEQAMYLSTINRNLLDFDFEKLCSVSLQNINVYCCLICGKYFQGRGKNSHCYFHSMDSNHHVFINLNSLQVWILPDLHLVTDSSLNDITFAINPVYDQCLVSKLGSFKSTDLNGKEYVAGYVGLNNIKNNDFINVIVHSISQVTLLRDYFLFAKETKPLTKSLKKSSELVLRFGTLIRKIWNQKSFKSHVSPHEFIQVLVF